MLAAKIDDIFRKVAVRKTQDLRRAGLDSRAIDRAVEAGLVVRPGMHDAKGHLAGLYVRPDAEYDPDLDDVIATILTGGVVARRTAAMRHGLAHNLTDTIEMLVPHAVRDVTDKANVLLIRSRKPESFGLGVDSRMTDLGVEVRMTSPARTVVDLFRSGRKDSDDYRTAITALATFLSRPGTTTAEVTEIARAFGTDMGEALALAADSADEVLSKGYSR